MRLAPLLLLAGAAGVTAAAVAVWPQLVASVMAQQSAFHRDLGLAFESLTGGGGTAAAAALVLASFLYGVFHAAGPGHGKAVLTGYLMTRPELLRRGVALAAAAALCQGVVAVTLVYGLVFLAGWLPRDAKAAVLWSERASFLLVMALGLVFLLRAGRSLVRRFARPHRQQYAGHDNSGHDNSGHDVTGHGCGHGCGHDHAPAAADLERADGWRTRLGLVLSMGLRPCSGAVLVLVFAQVSGMAWAGLAAVLAMSGGTAVATGGLAVLAVTLRDRSLRWIGGGTAGSGAGAMVAAAGGLFLLALGASLLGATFATRHPLAM